MLADPVIFIVGDVHADGGEGAFSAFLDRLAARQPARLVILGDLVEYWLETDAGLRRHAGLLGRLRDLAQRGWQLDIVGGNREITAGRRLEIASGGRLHWPHLDVAVGPQSVRIVHGDRLCHDPGYRAYSAFMRGFWIRALQPWIPAVVQDMVARLLRARSRSVQAQRTTVRSKRVFIDPRRVVAAARGADVLIAGHIHANWRRRIRGVDMMLVGDWPEPSGHWIEGYADGSLVARQESFSRSAMRPA